jgi:hypothetical protein
MVKEFSWSGTIVVLISLACILYYYLTFRHTMQSQATHHEIVVDNSTIYKLTN